MRRLLWLAAIAAPSTPQAIAAGTGYILVITNPSGGTTSVRYPSRVRCIRAREALAAEGRREVERQRRRVSATLIMVIPPQTTRGTCIPA